MLYRLEIENFYSIREPQVIDLIAGKSADDRPGRLAPIGPGLEEMAPKVIAFFGPNASGKSNVLKALSFLAWFVRESFTMSPDGMLPYSRFLHSDALSEPTRLAIFFTGPSDPEKLGQHDKHSCKYAYELVLGGDHNRPQRVISETLKYWTLETNRPVNLVHRDQNGEIKAHKHFGLAGYHTALERILRTNVSVISTLVQLRHPIATELWKTSTQFNSNILTERMDINEDAVTRIYSLNPRLLTALNKEIERIDFGIRELQLLPGANGPIVGLQHSGLNTPLLLGNESHGTRQFIRTFPLIFDALANGGLAVIDELDISIHPLILPEILSWFHDSKRNPHNAQLWMTAQNPSLLEDLTKEEIFFCEKDRRGRTSLYGLKNVQAVRRTENYYRKYLSGVYGAIPKLG
ncbi:MAG: AAA family ATPase [Candidatus Melainabacteria bacterium]|nr:AAA family ATPase [Candidatus Melainabacteria bacterium]